MRSATFEVCSFGQRLKASCGHLLEDKHSPSIHGTAIHVPTLVDLEGQCTRSHGVRGAQLGGTSTHLETKTHNHPGPPCDFHTRSHRSRCRTWRIGWIGVPQSHPRPLDGTNKTTQALHVTPDPVDEGVDHGGLHITIVAQEKRCTSCDPTVLQP